MINLIIEEFYDVKTNKFGIYKNTFEYFNKILSKDENESINKKDIKFKIDKSNKIKIIRILKNNKLVYNNNIDNNNINNENISFYNNNYSNKLFKKFLRSSSFRGVSKNGNKWQVLFMNNKKKYYLGNFYSEKLAAIIYDIFALKYKGKKASTNYYYTDEQITKIKELKI